MPYYRTCPYCGANLDPGEVCTCQDEENIPASVTSTGEDEAERIEHTVSTSYDNRNEEDLQA